MRTLRAAVVVMALGTSLLQASPAPADEFPFGLGGEVSTTESASYAGWHITVTARGTYVGAGGPNAAWVCAAAVTPDGSVPNPATAPVATQIASCRMTTAYPSTSPSSGRTLPGNAVTVHGSYNFGNTFATPVYVCVVGKVIFENNQEVRVPATGESCGSV